MQALACVRRAGLASISRAFSTIQLFPEQWISASAECPQNLDSTAPKTFQIGKSVPCSQELILGLKFYSTEAALSGDKEEKDALLEFLDEGLENKRWEPVDAAREICQVLEKGDEDMEATLTQLGIQVTPHLAHMVLDKISSPSSALRFSEWAKLQAGFEDDTTTSDKLVNILGRSKDFETLQRVLSERSPTTCNYSTRTFSFATAWHDDPDMLKEVMEMLEQLELSLRIFAYEMFIAALCEENYINAALVALGKMANTDCAPRMQTYRPLIQVYCQNNQMDKVHEVFEMMKDCPQDSVCYHIVLSSLCNRKEFPRAAKFVRRMTNTGYKLDAIAYNILIRAACNSGRIESALKLFDRLKEEGITPYYYTYTHILGSLFQIKGFDGAHSFLIQHSGKDRKLDSSNYRCLIRVCSKSGQEQEVRNLMMEMNAKGLD